MRIVVAVEDLSGFAGTEMYVLTIAEALQELGHDVTVRATTAGPAAELARERRIAVVTEPPEACDAVIAQDAAVAYEAAGRHPEARRLFVAHSDFHPFQAPPQLDGVSDAVVVLSDRVRRHVEALAAAPPVVRLRQPVDVRRFAVGVPAPGTRRALVLGNYLRGATAEIVTRACRQAGFEPVLSGAHTTPTATPELAIADADAVIGLGRCVLEAMIGRRAAYVYGIAGGDGWVTAESYPALEADGFGGTATDLIVDGARLTADLREWDPSMGRLNGQLATGRHDALTHARELVAILDGIRPTGRAAVRDADEMARLVRLQWQAWNRHTSLHAENAALRDAVEAEHALRVQAEAAGVESMQRTAEAEARLDALRATRRYRFALALARPMDAARASLRRR